MKKLLLVALGLAALMWPISAGANATTTTIPFNDQEVLCNGDTLDLSGTLLLVTTETTTPSGGFVASFHFQPQGLKAVDPVTGTTFVATGLTRDIFVTSPAGGSTETFVNRFHLQATGGDQSLIFTETFHVTFTPSGVISVQFDNFSATC